jgi:hypothetical protein
LLGALDDVATCEPEVARELTAYALRHLGEGPDLALIKLMPKAAARFLRVGLGREARLQLQLALSRHQLPLWQAEIGAEGIRALGIERPASFCRGCLWDSLRAAPEEVTELSLSLIRCLLPTHAGPLRRLLTARQPGLRYPARVLQVAAVLEGTVDVRPVAAASLLRDVCREEQGLQCMRLIVQLLEGLRGAGDDALDALEPVEVVLHLEHDPYVINELCGQLMGRLGQLAASEELSPEGRRRAERRVVAYLRLALGHLPDAPLFGESVALGLRALGQVNRDEARTWARRIGRRLARHESVEYFPTAALLEASARSGVKTLGAFAAAVARVRRLPPHDWEELYGEVVRLVTETRGEELAVALVDALAQGGAPDALVATLIGGLARHPALASQA